MSRLFRGVFYALLALGVCALPAAAQQTLLPTPTFILFAGAPFGGTVTSPTLPTIPSHATVGAALDIPILGPLAIEPNVAVTPVPVTVTTNTPGPGGASILSTGLSNRTMTTADLNVKISLPLNPSLIHPYLIAGAGVAHISGVDTKPTADVGIGATIALTRSLELRPEFRFGHTIFSSQTIPRLNRFTIGIGYTF